MRKIILAPLIQAFFTDRLQRQRAASPHTIASYRDTFRLLLRFSDDILGKPPSALLLGDIDAPLIGQFLEHQEKERGNCSRSRNQRLAAIRSFFRFVAFQEPAHSAQIERILAMPSKRHEKPLIDYLLPPEIDAFLAAPERNSWSGRRDHTLLTLAIQSGLRAAELTGLTREDVCVGSGPHVRCTGKGRKERCTPLTKETARLLAAWLRERGGNPSSPLFPNARGGRLSTDGLQYVISKHLKTAQKICPSLSKKNVSPHVLRHTTAMELLSAGIDLAVIALWLGHESVETTHIYVVADMARKEAALAKTGLNHESGRTSGRFEPDDQLLEFLENL